MISVSNRPNRGRSATAMLPPQNYYITPAPVRPGPLARAGKARTAILLWLLGVPLPLILLFFLIRGCMG